MNKIEMNKKYRTRDGRPARVICVDAKSTQPVVALVSRTRDETSEFIIRVSLKGEFYTGEKYELDLIEVTPYDDFKIDEPVMVRNNAAEWERRHFAGISDKGSPMTWNHGMTSWSAAELKSSWDECHRPTPEELK